MNKLSQGRPAIMERPTRIEVILDVRQIETIKTFMEANNIGSRSEVIRLIIDYYGEQLARRKKGKGEEDMSEQKNEGLTTQDYQEFDRFDEEQIRRELTGELIDEYVYPLKRGGKTIGGITYAGINKWAQEHGGIHCEDPQVVETDTSYKVVMAVTNMYNRNRRIGSFEQPKLNEDGKPNPFAFNTAISKAQRNGIRTHIDEETIKRTIETYLNGHKPIKTITKPQAPATKTDEIPSQANPKIAAPPGDPYLDTLLNEPVKVTEISTATTQSDTTAADNLAPKDFDPLNAIAKCNELLNQDVTMVKRIVDQVVGEGALGSQLNYEQCKKVYRACQEVATARAKKVELPFDKPPRKIYPGGAKNGK